jgi:hypothetical protein
MRGKPIFDPAIPLDWAGGTYAHIRLYTASEVKFLLEHVGLETYKIKYLNYGINNKTFIKRLIYKAFYLFLPSFAPEFIVVASKSQRSMG